MDDRPFNPAVGDLVIATDAHGNDHEVRVVRDPWREQAKTFVKVTVVFDSGDMMPWPLSAVRPVPALGIQEGESQ